MAWRSPEISLADEPAKVEVSRPKPLSDGYRRYERFQATLTGRSGAPITVERDILRGGRVICLLPVDLVRREVVLIRQFRLAGHLAIGKGSLVELVAGRVEANEDVEQAARRECVEEIGVEPSRLVALFDVMPTPGLTDELITFFIAEVDAGRVPERAGSAAESEDIQPLRVGFERAAAAAGEGIIHNGLAIIALQWLALNRERLAEVLDGSPR